MTNALPVHRMALPVGTRGDAPAAYVRADGLAVERLEQTYARPDSSKVHDRRDARTLVTSSRFVEICGEQRVRLG